MIWSIAEFESLYDAGAASAATVPQGFHGLPTKHFAALKELLAAQPQNLDDRGISSILTLSFHRGVGDVVTMRNYVGAISFANGDQIEVLPKLVRTFESRTPEEIEKLRVLLVRMFRAALDIDAKSISESDQRLARLPILEAFLRAFLVCVSEIVRHGLAGGYAQMEGNEQFYKGKLLVAQHLRDNLVRRNRFYIAYDSFRSDTPANRLIRSGLDFVASHSGSDQTRISARRLITAFEDIPPSANLTADFAACSTPPRDGCYRAALTWCGVFLRGSSLANLPRTKRAQAFLFPMEALFERYVTKVLRLAAPPGMRIIAQSKDTWLRSLLPEDSLTIRPDILLRRATDNAVVAIIDTKWKLLDPSRQHHGVSQSDFYQLAAYQRHHKANEAILVYPWHSALGELSATPPLYLHETDSPRIRIAFFDVASPKNAAMSLFETPEIGG